MFLRIFIIVIVALALIGCSIFLVKPKQAQNLKSIHTYTSSKKVVFLVVDSLMDQPLQEALQSEDVPALKFFMENGHYYPELVSSYPTMSVTIDSTLLTGTYADQHKVPGLVWFSQDEGRVISYGNSVFENIKLGLSNFVHDSLYQLNNADLSPNVVTIYESLQNNGLSTASINGLIARGNTEHSLDIPWVVDIFPKMPKEVHTQGPDLLSLGNLKRVDPSNGFLIHKYGMNDKRSIKELTYLIQNDAVPNFTLVYLPDNDRPVHNKGPNTLKGLKKLDKQLQNLLNVYPTWEDALSDITWVLLGDSAQSAIVKNKSSALLKLKDLLSDFQIAKIGDIKETDEIVFTPNERMAYIYALQDHIQLTDIKDRLFKDNRMDFVAWKEQDTIHVAAPQKTEELTFKKGGAYTDEYQQSWELQGDFSILDLTVGNDGTIEYGNYPDGLARLYGAIFSHEGRFLIAEAKPGHEFKGEGSPTHDGGGAHGSIHRKDSVAPILITGTDQLPEHYRIVDLKEWVLRLLLGQGDRNGVPPSDEDGNSTPH